jgi:Fe-S-cluster-containing hydrogenase component 2
MTQMSKESEKPSSFDILELLTETTKKKKKKQREELLAPLGVKEFFTEGSISINKRTCQGVECKLCIKACPTSALFWRAGEVGMTEELCIYCGACVLACIVDDCIRVSRRRTTGEVEYYSKPKEVTKLQHNISSKKRHKRIQDAFAKDRDYLKRYRSIPK